MMSTRILLVDDHAMVREGLRALLEREHDLKMVGEAATGLGGLTVREREPLQLPAEGNTAREMGDMLHLSVKTIVTHGRNVMQKLRLHSVTKLTKHAVREGVTSAEF